MKKRVKDIREILRFLSSEHSEADFIGYLPSELGRWDGWHICVSDYNVYTSEDFKLSLEAIRTKFDDLKMIAVFLNPSKVGKGIKVAP